MTTDINPTLLPEYRMRYLSACCILKDEVPFIAEWLTYHSLVGVEHFFVYDNESAVPISGHPLLKKYLEAGRATVVSMPGKTRQLPAYSHCLENFGPSSKWIAFIDLDEFICTSEFQDIRQLLAEFEDYACLAANWLCFGSSGHLKRPEGLVLQNYQELLTGQAHINLHIKSIVQPAKIDRVRTAHSFYPKNGEYAVNALHLPLSPGAPVCPLSHRRIRINHYLIKSQQDFEHKSARGRADLDTGKPTLDYVTFYKQSAQAGERDNSVEHYSAQIAEFIKTGQLPPLFVQDLPDLDACMASCAEFIRRGEIVQAEVCLCHASIHFSEEAQLWVMRAFLRRHQQKIEQALFFLQRAFRYNELPQAYEELMDVLIAAGQKRDAKKVLDFLKYAQTVQTKSAQLKRKLEIAEKLLA